MTLSFSTHWPKHMGEWAGQPNYFVEKILVGLRQSGVIDDLALWDHIEEYWDAFPSLQGINPSDVDPKLHTIRAGNRWRPGMKIHPVINNRTKNRFQFAPVIECTSVQNIRIEHLNDIQKNYTWTNIWAGGNKRVRVYVDEKLIDSNEIERLAINDGFESVDQFFTYFNTGFVGQIIHWTNLEY